MLKAALWTIIVVTALVIGIGIAAARKSAGMTAPDFKDGVIPPCSSNPNCVSTEVDTQHRAYIKPIAAPTDFARVEEHVKALGGQITNSSDKHIQAEFRSRLFRFVDDMMIKIDDDNKLLRVHSASRVGKSDLGANRKRVEALRQLVRGSVSS